MLLVRILQIILAISAIGILVIVHEFGHFITSKIFNIKVLEFMLGLPGPKLFSFQRGETTYGVTAIPFGGYVKTVGSDPYEELSEEEKKRSLEHAPVMKKTAVVLAGPFMNFIFAVLIMVIALKAIGPPVPMNSNRIGALVKDFPAYQSGIRPGDQILAIDGITTKNWTDLYKELSKKPNKKITLKIKHDNKIKTVVLKTKSVEGEGKIGISPITKNMPLPFLASIKEASMFMWMIISKTTAVIFNALTGKPHELLSKGKSVVGVVSDTSAMITSLFSYLIVVAALNAAIGFVNLLPIPPLDGGKIVVYIIEKIKGGYLSKKALTAINAVGLAFLLSVFVYFTVKDVGQILQSIYPKM